MMDEKKTISLRDLNLAKDCEEGFEFEYIDGKGNGTGIFFTVVGAYAGGPKKCIYAKGNQEIKQAALFKKRGKDAPVILLEESEEKSLEIMASFIIGWRGITEPWTPEDALELCKRNPPIVQQVNAAAENIANFTKSK